jgi:hypothetical protein
MASPLSASSGWVARILALSLVSLVGCESHAPGDTTSLSVRLKDAPGDVLRAVVTIREVDLVGSGGVHERKTATTTDLLTLGANATTLVQDLEVPSGTYSELRLKITGACIAVDNGDQTSSIYATADYDPGPCGSSPASTLKAPSYAQSGLKVKMAEGALEITGNAKVLLVDFDVAQSFGHETGDGSGWVLHPVVTGVSIDVDEP